MPFRGMKVCSHIVHLRVVFFAFHRLLLSAVTDGTNGDGITRFGPFECNGEAMCASSPPLKSLGVVSLTSCTAECHFKQPRTTPCIGFNYRVTNKTCDIYIDDPTDYTKNEAGCQYYQRRAANDCDDACMLQDTSIDNLSCVTPTPAPASNPAPGGVQSGGQAVTPILVKSLTGITAVSATALRNDQLFVTRSHFIGIYNTTIFAVQTTISAPIGTVYGLATIDNYVYVSDITTGQVITYSLSANSIISQRWTVPGNPYGLSVTSAGNLLVATGNSILEYTSLGKLVRQVSSSISSSSGSIWHAVELTNDTWVVSTCGWSVGAQYDTWVVSQFTGVSQICAIFTNGTMKKCIGSALISGLAPMNKPSCLAIDSSGYILVADTGNNRILVVNPSLTEFRLLPLAIQLQSPSALSLDNTSGRLYIGEASGSYRVLVFAGVTGLSALFN